MPIEFFGGVCVAVSILGASFIMRRKNIGNIFYIVSNIGWIVYNYIHSTWSQLGLFVLYLFMAMYAWCYWRKLERKEQEIKRKNINRR